MRGGDWLCIPLGEEVNCGCLARCLPLLCEVVIELVVHCLCERLYWLEKSWVLPVIVLPQNPRWRFLVWESYVDKLVDWKSFWVKAGT